MNSNNTKYMPDGYHMVTPYLIVQGAERLIAFLKEAFGAEERERNLDSDGGIVHAAVQIGDSVVELADAGGRWSPMPGAIHLFVTDTDEVYRRALQAGATSLSEPADMDYGERSGGVKDPCGNYWFIATYQGD